MAKRESRAARRTRLASIIDILGKTYPDAKAGLDFTNALELLVATIMSAQCTDERVNIVTKSLFRKYRTPEDYLLVPAEELEEDIRSTGFYKNKAKNIRGCCTKLIDDYGGEVPATLEELVSLPGVGRKTANCVLSNYYDIPGITVDTHVIRIGNLLQLVDDADPVRIEFALMDLMEPELWNSFNHRIITHGRRTCIARRPRCSECTITALCPSAFMPGHK